jgi:hypothetical protein
MRLASAAIGGLFRTGNVDAVFDVLACPKKGGMREYHELRRQSYGGRINPNQME